MIAKFSSWQPEKQDKPKAIFVIVPPSQCDGRTLIHDEDWQRFAKKYEGALVGCYLQDADPNSWIETYCNMSYGAGDKLIDFLKAEFKMEELPKLYMWGFSAGGQFNHEFANRYPELVGGYVVNKGGVYFSALVSDRARKLPALYIYGNRDAEFRQLGIKYLYNLNKTAGAINWYLQEEPVGHSLGDSEELGRTMFAAILGDGE